NTLAGACGLSPGSIKSIEQGLRTDPALSTLLKLAGSLGGSLAAFDGVTVLDTAAGTSDAALPQATPGQAPAAGKGGRSSRRAGGGTAEKGKRSRGKRE